MDKVKNRWLIAASAVGVHISIGSVYAYSVMTLPLNQLHGWQKSDITLAFSLAILFLGFSAAFLGRSVEKMGPRNSGRLAGILYTAGIMGAGIAVKLGSLPLFLLSYGVIGGIGLGVGYITPVSTLVKWFPDRRGLATGMAIMGFGFAAMIFGPIMAKLFQIMEIWQVYFVLGAIYFCLIYGSSLYLAPPPEGWVPPGYAAQGQQSAGRTLKRDLGQYTVAEAIRTKRFYFMWLMLFINITCGIALISVASPMAQEVIGLSPMQAATMVGLMGLFNGGGRIGWASLSDYLGRGRTYMAFFLIQICAFMALTTTTSHLGFQCLIFIILTCYGGGFSTLPAFLGDMFGTKQLGTIHGYELTAWGIAGMVGPSIVTRVLEATGSYTMTLYIFTGFLTFAFIVSCLLCMDLRQIRRRMFLEQQAAGETS
ncbi:L-lactate MFS transporter [Nitratidesulfovibrio vulgaris]|uniref:Major facilitator superfamily MFS_1 n=1 Tax=Nitratidesulfovibrio vulgaris (strain DP4) TaxID=391774 RepID=A0A0H3AB95_NITV4|nr:OFA family MFS transporter [Nitratidesulfovibrio vulgaris]ABM28907.1 major facilitator superfamily MFS_1 [Nitratidesulfovibrio vulgaris DP4]GEB78920.1 MFS transporter [Desulfovibrio desulfuricans]